jgi:hypothetical protein
MTEPLDLDAIGAELRRIADDAGQPNYRGDSEHFTNAWANVGRHVPALVAEVRRLDAQVAIEADRAEDRRDERDRARAELADEHTRSAKLRALAGAMLSHFVREGHPGEPCVTTGWVRKSTVVEWHRIYRAVSP